MPNLWCSCLVVRAQGPPFNLHGGEGWSFCRGQIIYFNSALQRAENQILLHVYIEQFLV